MTPSRPAALLGGRAELIAAIAFCTYEALPRSLTSLGPASMLRNPGRDALLILGLLFSAVVLGCIAYRSPFMRDRVVFGAAAGAFPLKVSRLAVLPGLGMLPVLGALESLLWAMAALAAAIAFVSS